jgi:hypothetical protein
LKSCKNEFDAKFSIAIIDFLVYIHFNAPFDLNNEKESLLRSFRIKKKHHKLYKRRKSTNNIKYLLHISPNKINYGRTDSSLQPEFQRMETIFQHGDKSGKV